MPALGGIWVTRICLFSISFPGSFFSSAWHLPILISRRVLNPGILNPRDNQGQRHSLKYYPNCDLKGQLIFSLIFFLETVVSPIFIYNFLICVLEEQVILLCFHFLSTFLSPVLLAKLIMSQPLLGRKDLTGLLYEPHCMWGTEQPENFLWFDTFLQHITVYMSRWLGILFCYFGG